MKNQYLIDYVRNLTIVNLCFEKILKNNNEVT